MNKPKTEEEIQRIVDEYRSKIVSFDTIEKENKKLKRKFYGRGANGLFFHSMTIILMLNTGDLIDFFNSDWSITIKIVLLILSYWLYWFELVCGTLVFHGIWLEKVARNIEKRTSGRIKLLWAFQSDWHDEDTDEGVVDKALGRWSFKICTIAAR